MSNSLVCTPIILPVKELLDSFDDYIGLILKSNKEEPHLMTASPGRQIQLAINKLGYIPQHLYLVSEEEIKEGDWILYGLGSKYMHKCTPWNKGSSFFYPEAYKIAATTDKSLGLPLIPQSFVEEYVAKQGKIDKVKVKVYIMGTPVIPKVDGKFTDEVIILPIEDKMYSREEVKDIIKAFWRTARQEPDQFHTAPTPGLNEWFDKTYPI